MPTWSTILIVALIAIGAVLLFRRSSAPRKPQTPLSGIQFGPIRHDSLPDALVERVRRLEPVFWEVYPRSHEEWRDGFKRDADPETEIVMWEQMAAAYARFTHDRALTLDAKREVLGLLLLRSAADEQSTIASAKLRYLNRAEARELVSLYSAAPQPVKVLSR